MNRPACTQLVALRWTPRDWQASRPYRLFEAARGDLLSGNENFGLRQFRIRRGAHCALPVRAAKRASGIAEKRAVSGAAIAQRRCGELKLCRRSQTTGAHNDVAKRIAIFHGR